MGEPPQTSSLIFLHLHLLYPSASNRHHGFRRFPLRCWSQCSQQLVDHPFIHRWIRSFPSRRCILQLSQPPQILPSTHTQQDGTSTSLHTLRSSPLSLVTLPSHTQPTAQMSQRPP